MAPTKRWSLLSKMVVPWSCSLSRPTLSANARSHEDAPAMIGSLMIHCQSEGEEGILRTRLHCGARIDRRGALTLEACIGWSVAPGKRWIGVV